MPYQETVEEIIKSGQTTIKTRTLIKEADKLLDDLEKCNLEDKVDLSKDLFFKVVNMASRCGVVIPENKIKTVEEALKWTYYCQSIIFKVPDEDMPN